MSAPTPAQTPRGLGPVIGEMHDLVTARPWPVRTQPATLIKLGRNYEADPKNGVRRRAKQGTQYGFVRSKGVHYGEDLYNKPGVPVFAPFAGKVEGVFGAGGDMGSIVMLRSSADGSIRARIVHLDDVAVKVGQLLKSGDKLGVQYRRARFPGNDLSHVHAEALLGEGGSNADKGNAPPWAVYDMARLYDRTTSEPGGGGLGLGGVLLLALVAGGAWVALGGGLPWGGAL